MREITIKPIGEIKNQITNDADYILCSTYPITISREDSSQNNENVLILDPFKDTPEEGSDAFTYEQAIQVSEFVLRPDAKEKLIVCCDFGQSRSPAIGAAVMMYDTGHDFLIWENPLYEPNPLVYRLCCKALNVHMDEGRIKWKIKQNNIARYDYIPKTTISSRLPL